MAGTCSYDLYTIGKKESEWHEELAVSNLYHLYTMLSKWPVLAVSNLSDLYIMRSE